MYLAVSQLQSVNHANHPCSIWQKLASSPAIIRQPFCPCFRRQRPSAKYGNPVAGNVRQPLALRILCRLELYTFPANNGLPQLPQHRNRGKVVGNCLAIFSALGSPAKYWRSYPPEFVVKEPLTICELHLVTRDDAPSDCTNSY